MLDRTAALQAQRADVVDYCRILEPAQWDSPSAAAGWRVRDVVAHLGGGAHALFTPASLSMLRSTDIERTNDTMVDARRDWPLTRVLGEFERWSARVARLSAVLDALPSTRVRLPLAELGRFPVGLMVGGAMMFDQHTHLCFDIAPAIGRAVPASDPNRMAVVLEWMLAVLGNQLGQARHPWLDRPVALALRGPGGGSWLIDGGGSVTPGTAAAAAQITAAATEFPEWGTRRAPWRDRDVEISGDTDYAEAFLDAVNVV